MKKRICLFFLCLLPCGAGAQEFHSLFRFSLFPRLGTNGPQEKNYANTVSLNLTVGISRSERAFALAGIANIVRGNSSGLLIAGAANHTGNVDGAQAAGLYNVAQKLNGLQIAAGANHAGNTDGAQIAGLYNVAKQLNGLQIAAGANHAGNTDGVQVAGLYNVAKRVKGVQIAFVNIAEENDFPIGLVNIIRSGEKGIALTYDASGNAILSFRSGGRYAYGILGVGYNREGVVAECGLGGRIPCCSWFRINNELKVTNVVNNGPLQASYSLLPGFLPGFLPGKHWELFGGGSICYLADRPGTVSFGWLAGVQFLF